MNSMHSDGDDTGGRYAADAYDGNEEQGITEQEESEERSRDRFRSIGIALICGVFAGGAALIFLFNVTDSSAVTVGEPVEKGLRRYGIPYSGVVMSRTRYLDTIYTTDSVYLEVDLRKQNVAVHRRDGASRTFRISSGNPSIRDGIATPTGVFTVQNKVPMAISKQFNDAKLHHWIGIQGGVGFHGLDGSGYYGYLGVRPSSHGCVRMSREEIAEMYKLVHSGALIAVHDGDPARVIAFCDPADTVNACLIDSASVHNRSLGRDRLRSIMKGDAWVDPMPRVVHIARQRLRWGMPMGKGSQIPKQAMPERLRRLRHVPGPESAPVDMTMTAVRSRWFAAASLAPDSSRIAEDAEWAREQSIDPRD